MSAGLVTLVIGLLGDARGLRELLKLMLAHRLGRAARRIAVHAAVLAPSAAYAHTQHESEADGAQTFAWSMSPDIVIGIAIFAVLYAVGLWRHRSRESAAGGWRHVSFFSGLAALFVALASPLDALADRLFFMHQVQHLLLQTIGPMLLLLAAPQMLLIAGMPELLRRRVLAPVMASAVIRSVFGFLTRPWIAAFALVASLYVWQWPPYHDASVLDYGLHYFMHVTMLAAGLLFYASIFDPRPAPFGPSYGTRISALLAAMTANMLLGAGLAIKDTVLYTAYDVVGRLWEFDALADERLGGLIVWIPGSLLCVPAFLVLLRMWGAREAQLDLRRERGITRTLPVTQKTNRRVACWLAVAAFIAFAGAISVGMVAVR